MRIKNLDKLLETDEFLNIKPNIILEDFISDIILEDYTTLLENHKIFLRKYLNLSPYKDLVTNSNIFVGNYVKNGGKRLFFTKPQIGLEIIEIVAETSLNLDPFLYILLFIRDNKTFKTEFIKKYIEANYNVYRIITENISSDLEININLDQYIYLLLKYADYHNLPSDIIIDYNKLSPATFSWFIGKNYEINIEFSKLSSVHRQFLNKLGTNPVFYKYLTHTYVVYDTNSGSKYMAELSENNIQTLILYNTVIVFKTVLEFDDNLVETSDYDTELWRLVNSYSINIDGHNNELINDLEPCIEISKSIIDEIDNKEAILTILEYYVSDVGFRAINNYCRSNFIVETTPNIENIVIVLNNIICDIGYQLTNCIQKVFRLYRGSKLDLKKIYTPITIGSIINNNKNQFISFSSSYDIARQFSGICGIIFILTIDMTAHNYIMPLIVRPENDSTNPYADEEDIGELSDTYEKEWLLPLNTSFIINSKPYTIGNIYHIPISIYSQDRLIELTPIETLSNNINNIKSLL
jgi:hypothetical protein